MTEMSQRLAETPSEMQLSTHEECLRVRPDDSLVSEPLYHPNPEVPPFYQLGRLKLSVTIEDKGRDGIWYHVSYSLVDGKRIPTHRHTVAVRKAMFRSTSVVVAVFPPENEYINDHNACLHLWERLDVPRLIPDLREFDSRAVLSI